MMKIVEAANELKLAFLKENHQQLIKEYQARGLNIEEAIEEWLNEEVMHRRDRSHQRRYKSYNKITQFVARNFPQLQKQLR